MWLEKISAVSWIVDIVKSVISNMIHYTDI